MKKFMSALIVVVCWLASPAVQADTPSISEFTESMQPHQGFFSFYHDPQSGSVYLQVPKQQQQFIFQTSLP